MFQPSVPAGGVGMAGNGVGFPMSYLDNSPFTSFLVPALILGVVVGGTQLAGVIGLLAGRRWGLLLSVVAGFGMLIWIFVELAIIGEYSVLQTVYFAHGGLELIFVLALLGIAPSIVAPWQDVQGALTVSTTEA